MIRILTATNKKALNAGPKAKLDIVKILKKIYKNDLEEETVNLVDKSIEGKKNTIIDKLCNFFNVFELIIKNLNYKGFIIIQYPFIKNFFLRLLPKENTIIIIHDLTGIRTLNEKIEKEEIKTLNKFKYIIVHNKKMHEYLINKGIKCKIVELELFDYLCIDDKEKEMNLNDSTIKVAYVGNLNKFKSPFIYQLDDRINYHLDLYGNGIEKNDINNNNISYCGAYKPDELPNIIESDLGLVWDGNYDESDENEGFKNYTKYNNPHKLSCYIAANIPVVVWRKSAVADFVVEHNIGYCIENLYDINKIKKSDIRIKRNNMKKISKNVKDGIYIKRAMEKIVNVKEN